MKFTEWINYLEDVEYYDQTDEFFMIEEIAKKKGEPVLSVKSVKEAYELCSSKIIEGIINDPEFFEGFEDSDIEIQETEYGFLIIYGISSYNEMPLRVDDPKLLDAIRDKLNPYIAA